MAISILKSQTDPDLQNLELQPQLCNQWKRRLKFWSWKI